MLNFKFPNYKLFEYEKKLAKKELAKIFPSEEIYETEIGYNINLKSLNDKQKFQISKLTFLRLMNENGYLVPSLQEFKESSCLKSGHTKRQSTRYGAHGLHEYKGKFNPQIVSSILNVLGVDENSKVLEPFCGSGTTLYESALNKIEGVGFDFNPLACFISNAKLSTLGMDIEEFKSFSKDCIDTAIILAKNFVIENDTRLIYLKKWFEIENLKKLEVFRFVVLKANNEKFRNLLFALVSDLVREYSLQEPADLRIRRRTSEMPDIDFWEAVNGKVHSVCANIKSLHDFDKIKIVDSKAINIDIRDSDALKQYRDFDCAITSPPYATALPYIDTQRLSIVWLGLASPDEVKKLDRDLIGSRELSPSLKRDLMKSLIENSFEIPVNLHELCLEMFNSLTEKDGFRRQAMPFIVYRYFSDMKKMFENVFSMMKADAKFALVVGHNSTTLGGKLFKLDTPSYLIDIAKLVGWTLHDDITLEVYKRYELHKLNSIDSERLVILRKKRA
ncbi:site-specific DNA-methyltransferase (cytosine-N4-specific) [Pantoea ananatis]|uniref:DNA methylase n=1 Tax=Pantoea ananas TaxID=553 RepID=UPI000DC61243|nr:DNA methylase [Pantoea ananatis]RAR74688.1 site-specific DNA-methyltransferase (cytosine-N4-specific) [Pantoea ananatis]